MRSVSILHQESSTTESIHTLDGCDREGRRRARGCRAALCGLGERGDAVLVRLRQLRYKRLMSVSVNTRTQSDHRRRFQSES